MSVNDQILAEVDGFIGRFTINNAAKRNCITLSMWQRMGDVFATWADDPAVRVIIVRGAGDLVSAVARCRKEQLSAESNGGDGGGGDGDGGFDGGD